MYKLCGGHLPWFLSLYFAVFWWYFIKGLSIDLFLLPKTLFAYWFFQHFFAEETNTPEKQEKDILQNFFI